MARTIKPLTEKEIKNAKPTNKTYTMFDGGGLYLEITPKGGKWWRLKYRFEGKEKRKSLGTYPTTSLSDARKKREDAKREVAKGTDPFAKPVNKAAEIVEVQKTFKEWSDWYIDRLAGTLSDSHITRTIKGWKKDVYPVIGDIGINEIKARDIIKIMHIMKERDAAESAKKVFSSISRVYQVVLANFPDDIERNPCADIKLGDVLGKSQRKNYPIITDEKELGALLNNLEEYSGDISTKLALKMIAHTFVRPINIRFADWSDINLATKQWVIPAEKMKMKKELIVPLSNQVIEILKQAKEHSGGEGLIFPSPKSKTQPLSDNAMVGALRRLGYTKDEIVAHSFRGMFSTIAHEKSGYGHDVIETQLAHSIGSAVSQAYNRAQYLKERIEMMQWWSDYLEFVSTR